MIYMPTYIHNTILLLGVVVGVVGVVVVEMLYIILILLHYDD